MRIVGEVVIANNSYFKDFTHRVGLPFKPSSILGVGNV
jgi:hypothetical protein